MTIQPALKSQYHASLKALYYAIEKCPDDLWDSPDKQAAPFWRVVYHTLFYTHFYLQRDQHSFTPWKQHREEANFIASIAHENSRLPKPCVPYTREELVEYWRVCNEMIDTQVDALDLSAPECGFPWYKMSKLEHQIVNIRHIQHHAAALSARLRLTSGIAIDWVGKG